MDLIAIINQPAFSLLGVTVSWSEVVGDVSGAACVWLVARQNIWTWPLGLVNNIFWCILFWAAKLYSDAVLQVAFFVFGVYGWWTWLVGRGEQEILPVRGTAHREWIALGVAVAALTAAVSTFLTTHTDSPAPFWDASVLTISLAATYGQAHKLLESWWLWILVDVISVPLYVSRALYPTALLYFIFGCMCVRGLQNWQRSLRTQDAVA